MMKRKPPPKVKTAGYPAELLLVMPWLLLFKKGPKKSKGK